MLGVWTAEQQHLEEVARLAVGAIESFAFVLVGAANALLKHGLLLQLVPDRSPDGLPKE